MSSSSVPKHTRAVVATAYGGPEVLETIVKPLAEPGPGEALLEVRAAGVNPADWKRYGGDWGKDPSQLPMPIGFEASGVVVAVGSDAVGDAGPVQVGDEVIGFGFTGAVAEYVLVDAAALVPKPAGLSFEEAGGLMVTGATATHLLEATATGVGDAVLLHGGSGGVGLMVIQIAVARGAQVVATASERRHEALRALGATPITYGDGLLERAAAAAPDGFDAAIDAAGTPEALEVSLELVADRGRIATIVPRESARDAGIKMLGNGPGLDPGTEIRSAAKLQLTELVERGVLSVPTTARPMSEVADAHRESIEGHSYGKVVLVP
jgi:NADPH:quinone reductase-like Zn-dependent oxidoreductase